MAEESKFINSKRKKEKTGPYITKKRKKLILVKLCQKLCLRTREIFFLRMQKRKENMRCNYKKQRKVSRKTKTGSFYN